MSHHKGSWMLLGVALTVGACATAAAPERCATPTAHAQAQAHGHGHDSADSPRGFAGAASRSVALSTQAAAGDAREVHVLVNEPALKLVSITLRRGTVLPEHHSAVAVTIQALSGRGSVVVGGERMPLDASHAVALAPRVGHSVEPEAGTDLVLLVHHMGQGGEHHE
jgi:quercetin dioxygenase-like cupin family protein